MAVGVEPEAATAEGRTVTFFEAEDVDVEVAAGLHQRRVARQVDVIDAQNAHRGIVA
jgi:hypothetical protein